MCHRAVCAKFLLSIGGAQVSVRDRQHCPLSLENSVRPDGAFHQWREDPPGELSMALVADERRRWVTGGVEAS